MNKIDKTLKIAVPPGIGDSLWSLTKVQSIMAKENYDKCVVALKSCYPRRGAEFIRSFDFVDQTVYEEFSIHPVDDKTILGHLYDASIKNKKFLHELGLNSVNDYVEETGEYIYTETQRNYLGKYDWLLISNGHLERGNRLETWLPEFDTNFDIANNFVFNKQDTEYAQELIDDFIGGPPYVVFYIGPKAGNTFDGHNRNSLWTLEDWHTTSELMLEQNKELSFVIVGAQYDLDYTMEFLEEYDDGRYISLVGSTSIGATYSLIKQSKFLLSYQSGIGIFSVYMRHPTACFWRPYGDSISPMFFLSFQEEMASAWAPPWSLGDSGNYMPLIYTKCSPESIVDECINRRFI